MSRLDPKLVVLCLQMFESEENIRAQALETDHLQTTPEVLGVGLAHGQTEPVAVHRAGGGPVDDLHHAAKDPIDLHQFVRALLRCGEIVLGHFVHQVVTDPTSSVRDLDDEVLGVTGEDDVDSGQTGSPHMVVVLYGRPDGILQELRQDVVQGHLNVGEVDPSVAGYFDGRTVAVLVLAQLHHKVDPPLANVLQTHPQVDETNVALLVLLQQEVVRHQHPDAQSGGQGLVQEGGDDEGVRDVFLTFSETLGQTADHILVVLQQRLEYLVIFENIFVGENLREIIEDVESSDVELVYREDGGVTAHDER